MTSEQTQIRQAPEIDPPSTKGCLSKRVLHRHPEHPDPSELHSVAVDSPSFKDSCRLSFLLRYAYEMDIWLWENAGADCLFGRVGSTGCLCANLLQQWILEQ
jgi:hypothetical protein